MAKGAGTKNNLGVLRGIHEADSIHLINGSAADNFIGANKLMDQLGRWQLGHRKFLVALEFAELFPIGFPDKSSHRVDSN